MISYISLTVALGLTMVLIWRARHPRRVWICRDEFGRYVVNVQDWYRLRRHPLPSNLLKLPGNAAGVSMMLHGARGVTLTSEFESGQVIETSIPDWAVVPIGQELARLLPERI